MIRIIVFGPDREPVAPEFQPIERYRLLRDAQNALNDLTIWPGDYPQIVKESR